MTDNEADKAQEWKNMDGATAWWLIYRHADDWSEAGAMMDAWLRANVNAEREACAIAAFEQAKYFGYNVHAEAVANAILSRGSK